MYGYIIFKVNFLNLHAIVLNLLIINWHTFKLIKLKTHNFNFNILNLFVMLNIKHFILQII